MKTTVPEALKADLPPSKWGKILSGTPVVLAVVATMLAGLASSEMTKAQYDRSYAAQLQSKAGDQWSFFQAKRLRSALQNNTLDVILNTSGRSKLDRREWLQALAGTPLAAELATPAGETTLAVLSDRTLPKRPAGAPLPPNIQAALAALESGQPETEFQAQLAQVSEQELEVAVRTAREQTLALDHVLKPVGQIVDQMEQQLDRAQTDAAVRGSFIAARLGYNARRYDAEARLNQGVASLYELQVRKANVSSARHHRRSQKFFFGMLAAQLGVIVSTLAIAARQRSVLWAVAAAAGAAAVAFAGYVYVFV